MGWEGLRTMGTALAGLQLTPPNPPPPPHSASDLELFVDSVSLYVRS